MVSKGFDMYIYSVFLVMSLLKITDAVFSFQCPVQSHWKHRAETNCGSNSSYFCLYDKNEHIFTEFCRQNQDFEAPGRKLIVAGSSQGTLQGADCDSDFYQPFKFLSSGNHRCVYTKSYCNEDGQVVYSNGTEKNERSCRCDYTRGFDFITSPKHQCHCEPSEEDCSCHLRTCPPNHILSPDYECLNVNEWKTSFDCKSMLNVHDVLPKDPEISLLADKSSLESYVLAYRKAARVGVLVVFMLMSSVSIILLVLHILKDCLFRMKRKRTVIKTGICFLSSECFLLRLIHCFTGIDEVLFEDRGELDDTTATYVANEKSDIDRKIVFIEDVNQELKDKIKKLENDIVKFPSHVKAFQNETLQDWGRKLNKIVKTRATEFIYEKVRTRKVIVIVGPTGAGKSAIAYYAAFRLKEENGYTIIPARQSVDIANYHVPGIKQIFVIDDFIGRYAVDETDEALWEKNEPLLKMIFSNNDDTKLILTSRTYIWQPDRYTCLRLDAYTCDLLSDHIRLSLTERRDICQSYLNKDDIKALKDETLLMYSFFPSLCYSYMSSDNIQVENFFTVPYQIIGDEINNFKIKSQVGFIALAILAIKGTIPKTAFSIDNHEYDELFQDVFQESAFLQYPSQNLLKSSLVAFTGTYVKKATDNFIFSHDTLQKIILRYIASTLTKSVIKYCKTEVILNQLRLDCIDEKQNDFTIEVTDENEDIYFRRLVNELGKGWNKAVFENEQNTVPEFRYKFLQYLKNHISRDCWTKTQGDMPALHVVSALGYQDYTFFFMQDNAMINQKDSAGNIPLHLACMKGHAKIVKHLVDRKSSIGVANNDGLTPFVCACENNAIKVAKTLLHHCAKWINLNEKYQKRNKGSVLHIVSAKGFVNLVLLLLENKADVDVQDESGCTPLHLASNSAIVKALLDYDAKINQVDAFGRSPVYLACSTKQEKVLELLIEKNAEINQKTKAGLRPLHAACQSGSIGIVKILLKKGVKINSSEPCVVPLHEACKIGNEGIINTLIAANASVNHKTKDGLTPLHEACRNERFNAVQILLVNKANVNGANKYGWTALFFSCARGCRTIVDFLLQHGANVNIRDEDKVSPLIVACKEEYTDVVDSLLSSKANVNDCDRDNCSSLLLACKTGNVDLVSVLLRYGADINLADKDMITPLHAACMNNNNTKLVLKLVESNANVNAADKTGQTPLFKSIFNGYTNIVDILLRHGAFFDICDKSGDSPLAMAEIKGHTTIVDILRQHRPNNQITLE